MSEKVQPDGATSMSRLDYLERVATINGSQADTYRDLCDQLKAENAQLRQQLADVTESMGRVEERCAKLRELARDMYRCSDPCNDCPHYNVSNSGYYCGLGIGWKARRMRELGIEVAG